MKQTTQESIQHILDVQLKVNATCSRGSALGHQPRSAVNCYSNSPHKPMLNSDGLLRLLNTANSTRKSTTGCKCAIQLSRPCFPHDPAFHNSIFAAIMALDFKEIEQIEMEIETLMNIKYILILPLVICLISGCSGKKISSCENDVLDGLCTHEEPKLGEISKATILKYHAHEPWAKRNHLPQVGLSLSGGGSRAAPFAMGVLKRFVDEGWIESTDIISSVSGGGYPAYYLYSKANYLSDHPELTLKDMFIFSLKENKLDESKGNIGSFYSVDYSDKLVGGNENCSEMFKDSMIYQKMVMCYQDLLSFWSSEKYQGIDNTRALKTVAFMGAGIFESVASWLFYGPTNVLFDWNVSSSPTRAMYKNGIRRAYGTIPVPGYPGSSASYKYADIGFYQVRDAIKKHGLPMWILNTTAENSGGFQSFSWDKSDYLSQRVFELSPYGFGSNGYGYVNSSPDNIGLNISNAVLASAGFLDTQEETWVKRLPAHLGLQLLNARWGVDIRNYNVSDFSYGLHNVLFAPFYFIHNTFAENSPNIHLSDGGHSGDNLGIYSLIKRGTRNIIAVQGSHVGDEITHLEDLCEVQGFLKNKDYSIHMRGDPMKIEEPKDMKDFNLSAYCNDEGWEGLNLSTWKKTVWEGSIVRVGNRQRADSADDSDPINGIHIWLIQAAVDKQAINEVATKFLRQDKDNRICNATKFLRQDKDNRICNRTEGYPCMLLRFWISNSNGEDTTLPGSDTVHITLDSSQGLYQGFFSLGYYAAGKLPFCSKISS